MSVRSDWAALLQLLSPQSGQRILDVGAGKGALAGSIARAGIDVYAVDPQIKNVEAINRDYPSVKASVAGAESLPFADAFFDSVYTTMALHHFADIDRALSEVARVLKTGGSLVVLEVDPGSVKGTLFRFLGRLMGEHMNMMTKEQLSARLASATGLKVAGSVGAGSGYLIQLVRV